MPTFYHIHRGLYNIDRLETGFVDKKLGQRAGVFYPKENTSHYKIQKSVSCGLDRDDNPYGGYKIY
jgi:hypothetical protein